MKLLFTHILLILSLITFASEGLEKNFNVGGEVVMDGSGDALIAASVGYIKEDKEIWVAADNRGVFKLSKVPLGKLDLTVHYVGCTQKFSFQVEAGKSNYFILKMIDCSVLIDPVNIIGDSPQVSKGETGTGHVLPPARLELTNPLGTQEALDAVPGVHGFSDDGAGNSRQSIGIRGLNPRRSSRVLILEDGIPIQPALYVYPNMYYNPPVERIRSIEVIKGSGAIQYGPQTMGGVINYVTSRPRKESGGLVQLSGGNNGLMSTYVEVGGFGNAKLAPEIQLLYKRGNGFRVNNDFDQINATAKVNYQVNEETSWYVKLNLNKENSQATYTGLTEYSFEKDPWFNPKENDEFDVLRIALDAIKLKLVSEDITETTKIYANYFQRDWWRENDVFVDAQSYEETGDLTPVSWYTPGDLVRVGNGLNNFGILRSFYVVGYEKSIQIEHEKIFKGKLNLGGRLHFERFIDDKKTGFSPTDRTGKYFVIKGVDDEWNTWNEWTGVSDSIIILGQAHTYETTALSLFFNEEINLKKLVVKPGLRMEAFEQTRIDRLNGSRYQDKTIMVLLPGLGVNYEFKNVNLFGGIHRGFTPPSSGALKVLNFGNSSTGLDLEAEKSWNSEAGFRGTYKATQWELALFNLDIENMVAAGRGTVFKNLGLVNTKGIEFAGKIDITMVKEEKSWAKYLASPYISYTYLETSVKTGIIASSQGTGDVDISGNELPYAPTHAFTAGLEKEFGKSIKISIETKFMDAVFTDFENIRPAENRGDQGMIPSYTLFNANVLYEINNNWRMFLSAKNITNRVYLGSRLHSSPGQPQANLSSGIMPGAGRQFNVGIKYQFGK